MSTGQSLKNKIRNAIRDVYYAIFCDFWHKLGRATSWFMFMWNNNEWDYQYLWKVLYKRITEIRNHTKKYSMHCSAKHHVKIMSILLWYIERLVKVDACDKLNDLFYEKYGHIKISSSPHPTNPHLSSMEFAYEKCDTQEKYEYASKVSMRIHKMEERRYKKYQEKVFYIMNKYIQYWWD